MPFPLAAFKRLALPSHPIMSSRTSASWAMLVASRARRGHSKESRSRIYGIGDCCRRTSPLAPHRRVDKESSMRRKFVSCGTSLLMLLVLPGSGASTAVPATSPGPLTRPCRLPDIIQAAQCGALSVLENPDRADARRLSIHFAVIPAASAKALSDPIVVLMGGPGEKAIESASIYVGKLKSLLTDRDLLLVDQRGTGQSAPLGCHLFSAADPAASVRDFFPLAAVSGCVRELKKTADLARYTFPYFASDLEQ